MMRDLRGQSPEIVQTPPPDTNVFPKIEHIRSGRTTPFQGVDLAYIVHRMFWRPNSCWGPHRQDDILDCRVTFEGKPELVTVVVDFSREEKPTSHYQSQLCHGFGVGFQRDLIRIADGTFEVRGQIPKCGSGRYRVASVGAFGYSGTDSTKLYAKDYINGLDFNIGLVMKLKDTAHRKFPAIVEISQEPPRQ
jgi:hypothetical protein